MGGLCAEYCACFLSRVHAVRIIKHTARELDISMMADIAFLANEQLVPKIMNKKHPYIACSTPRAIEHSMVVSI